MPENQGHGKFWERELGLNVYRATEAELASISHTANIDIPRAFNRLDGTDVSIKVTGGRSVDIGDIVRVYKEVSSGEPIHLVVISWTQVNSTTKRLQSIVEIDLTNSTELLFGTATLLDIEALVDYVKSIPHYGRTAEHQVTYKKMASSLKRQRGGWLSYAPKVDSAKQRRVQGHFGQFHKFVQAHPTRIIATSHTCEFRGGKIAEEINSTPRIRNTKLSLDSAPHSPLI
jgi:hypothetical protein